MTENFYKYTITTHTHTNGKPAYKITRKSKVRGFGEYDKVVESYWCSNDEQVKNAINKFKERIEYRESIKVNRANERKNFVTSLKVGDILDSSWGYDQTNVDFYQVLEVKSAKRIVVREITHKSSDHLSHGMACYVSPVKDVFVEKSEPITCSVGVGDYVRIDKNYKFRDASKWDGQPMYCSWYA